MTTGVIGAQPPYNGRHTHGYICSRARNFPKQVHNVHHVHALTRAKHIPALLAHAWVYMFFSHVCVNIILHCLHYQHFQVLTPHLSYTKSYTKE